MGHVVALIPAAGRGLRMGLDIGKPYVPLCGRPVLAHTVDAFDRCPHVDGCVLVVDPERQEHCRTHVVEAFGYRRVWRIVPGGATRQESVYRGLQAIEGDADIVIVHDGVRPLIEPEVIEESVVLCRTHGAVLVAVPVKETIKIVHDGVVVATPDRATLWAAQTPQTFSYALLRDAHERARADGYEGTDDAALVERLGHRVTILRGSYENIKLTTPEDVVVAEQILRRRGNSRVR
ncbi:MAG: 2-C-methyl-D-erythritol 4-phosphate cytidylyltransferase [Candidatus Latescibacteria bacterium]|nr:2-C-methyl-D-erythritol 4-phosphate cytidylyltransferase [Candidatus Latescibacterota bacterium]